MRSSEGLEQRGFTSRAELEDLMASVARLGHTVEPLEVSGPLADVARALGEMRPDLVFNLAEGWSGPWRQSAFPELYEQLGLSYTGSGPRALALALDKYRTKLVLREAGVPTPPAVFLTPGAPAAGLCSLSFPVIVKPNFESCSKGITGTSLAHTAQEAAALAAALLEEYPDGVLVEEYVPGRDITVPYLTAAGGPLPVAETTMPATVADGGVFDYDLKQDPARWQHLKVPAPVPETLARQARHLTSLAFDALGLLDMARADFRLDPEGALHLLEVNGLPGLPRDGATHRATVLAGLDPQDGMAAAVITSALNRSAPGA
ncbi:D-alanine--D-alanine ligase family protein [Streptomyces sp. NPDC054932]